MTLNYSKSLIIISLIRKNYAAGPDHSARKEDYSKSIILYYLVGPGA